MTELVRRDAESATTEESGPDLDTEQVGDAPEPPETAASTAAQRVRARGRRVRRRELDTALARLREEGDLSCEERRVVELLATRLADALVEEWAGKLADDEVDPETALGLLTE